ncbi:uncharacterized protein KY384_000872 [Bacidia gigantensis]|uniref:uncharacterized protein n=1 Tax=Bacidia gigantensis TaxID=2732470 RepID=UPI001D04797F|nr:uncharacterized protein KY384_000872 [Bacidia gigantensis]KAG8534029.1 hypothetical protein KY384_000872 [Bacidia gigantensis]
MDLVNILGSNEGIASLGAQLGQLLQMEMVHTPEPPFQILVLMAKLGSTSERVSQLNELLKEDIARDDKIISIRGIHKFYTLLGECNDGFRRIAILIAKAGPGVLLRVKEHQNRCNSQAKEQSQGSQEMQLQFEVACSDVLVSCRTLSGMQGYNTALDVLEKDLGFCVNVLRYASMMRLCQSDQASDARKTEAQMFSYMCEAYKNLLEYTSCQDSTDDRQAIEDNGHGPNQEDSAVADVTIDDEREKQASAFVQNWSASSCDEQTFIEQMHDLGIEFKGLQLTVEPHRRTFLELPINTHELVQRMKKYERNENAELVSTFETFCSYTIIEASPP